MAGPAALRGFAKLAVTDTTNNVAFFPYLTSFNATKTTETVDKFAFQPCGGTGVKTKIASFQGQADWNIDITMNVASWLDLQLLYGQQAQSASITVPKVYCDTVSSNIITNAALNGVAASDVKVTWGFYDSTAGNPVQFTVDVGPAVPSATQVILDNAGNTLTFDTGTFNGQTIFYTIDTAITKPAIGMSNPTSISGLSMYGEVFTNGSTTSAGYGLWIPSLTLDGNIALAVTGGDDEISVPATPVLASGYSEPVVMIQL